MESLDGLPPGGAMSGAPPATGEPLGAPRAVDDDSSTRRARRVLAIVVAAIVAGAVVLAVLDPFGGGGSSSGGGNGFPTSLQTVTERALSAHTQVNGTLGFAGDSTIRVPVGIATTVAVEAQGSVASDRRLLGSARSSLGADQVALADARATLTAAQQRLAVDCAGDKAAAGGSSSNQGAASGATGCASDAQLVSSDRQTQAQAAMKVSTDQAQVSSAQRALASAGTQLLSARAHETFYGQDSTYTALPSPGRDRPSRQTLFAIDGAAGAAAVRVDGGAARVRGRDVARRRTSRS